MQLYIVFIEISNCKNNVQLKINKYIDIQYYTVYSMFIEQYYMTYNIIIKHIL